MCESQPAQLSDLFCPTQSTQVLTQHQNPEPTPETGQTDTRFWVAVSRKETDKFLHGLLEKMHYAYKCKTKGIFTIETQDGRGDILSFRCTLIPVDHRILVDFRLSRDCGIAFKRHFAKIKNNCGNVIEKAPIMLPTFIAFDAIPGGP